MNTTIYLASCGDFGNYELLKLICNYFTQNIKHDDITFISPLGGKNCDIICRNYIIKNNLNHIFLKPSQMDKEDNLQRCNHAILFNNGRSKGINISLKIIPIHIHGKIVEVHTNLNKLTIYQLGKEPITKSYSISNNMLKLT
jgi:hypothetical protein